jgi:hypothetical protein
MAKVFHYVLMHTVDRASLPWRRPQTPQARLWKAQDLSNSRHRFARDRNSLSAYDIAYEITTSEDRVLHCRIPDVFNNSSLVKRFRPGAVRTGRGVPARRRERPCECFMGDGEALVYLDVCMTWPSESFGSLVPKQVTPARILELLHQLVIN